MSERKYLISAVQVFCFVFCHLLSGMILYARGSTVAALFASLFCACVSVAAAALCENFYSSRSFYAAAFGALGAPMRLISAALTSYSLVNTLRSFSEEADVFYGGSARASVLVIALLLATVFAVRSFAAPARFAELCVFPLLAAVLVSLTGGGGEGLSFAFSDDLLFVGFDIIGSAPVIFSLFMRSTGEKSEKMSVGAQNSAFRPSTLVCGIFAAAASLIFYAFFRLSEGRNIMLSFFLWFAALSRISAHAVALYDLSGLPESTGARQKAGSLIAAAAVFAFSVLASGLFHEAAKTAAVFANVIFPCAVFAACVPRRRSAEKTSV
ncbi:MAG: hypothetical protein IJW21_09745 [Clostridia bacterium]|nr:hypothetical protein [Clostridia bacterium]